MMFILGILTGIALWILVSVIVGQTQWYKDKINKRS